VSSGTVVTGSGAHNNTVDCGNDAGTAGPPASGGGSGGCPGWTVNPSSLTIKKQGATNGTINFAITSGGSAVVSASAPANLQVTPAVASLSAGGSATFTVTSLNKTRGTFAVTFNLPCSSPQVLVKVTN
ncbi:MAG TPA: hypothetical protein VHQ64_18245, partial [Pyrinomonadaceae bacterium]|nr:hypothetical protein [Pyrinomonadaceae bacterium]